MHIRSGLLLCLLITGSFLNFAYGQVVLNEILYDSYGTDDPNVLFTEIYGPAGTDLTGWTLVGINGNGGAVYQTITLQGVIPADGYYVVGNTALVPEVDFVCGGGTGSGVDWQNAGSASGPDCDGIDLRNAVGNTVDHVCYGVCAAGHVCTGEGGHNAPDPSAYSYANRSIVRIPDHMDTGDNGADWQETEDVTPGAPNDGTPCPSQNVTLAEVRQNDTEGVPLLNNTFVVVRGIATVAEGVFDTTGASTLFMQDDDAGCEIYHISHTLPVAVGDCLTVSGWVGQYRGLTELMPTGTGNCTPQFERTGHVEPPVPALITGTTAMEPYEGMLVRLNNVVITSGSWPAHGETETLVVSDGTGMVGLLINRWTDIPGSTQPPAAFDVIGILSQYDVTSPYDSYYEIMPRSREDIIDNPLAVELLSFTASPGDRQIALNWRTASELNNDHFVVLRDGAVIAQLASLGNSSEEHHYQYTDNDLTNGITYRYALQSVSTDGQHQTLAATEAVPSAGAVVTHHALHQNYPNPFNPTTEIRFDLAAATRVDLKIYNTLGQQMATLVDDFLPAGSHTVRWNGQSSNGAPMTSGLYLCEMKAGAFTAHTKMLLIH